VKLSFMTWVCPDWDLNQILTGAIRYGYDGVEPRVEVGQKHGIDLQATKKQRKEIKTQFADCGVDMSCLATSRTYSSMPKGEREQSVELTLKYIDLAAELGCPCLRVFGGQIPADVPREEAEQYVAECLRQCGEYAAQRKVFVCLETHDDFSSSAAAARTVTLANHPNVGIVWDVMHPFRMGDTIAEAFERVKPFVHHCHVHDGVRPAEGAGGWELALMGEGDIPHDEAVRLLATVNFPGHLSGEWISFRPAEEVLPHDARVLREYIRSAS
jgi:sugar phosphate isomerase/epimerase